MQSKRAFSEMLPFDCELTKNASSPLRANSLNLLRDFPCQLLIDNLFEHIKWLRADNCETVDEERWC